MANDNQDSESGGEKVQKNLNIRSEYADSLERMAEDIYDSKYAQGRIIEDLIDLTTYKPVNTQIRESLTEMGYRSSVISSDVAESEQEGRSNTPQQQEAQEEEEVGIDDIKGARSVDRGKVVAEHIKKEFDEPVTKGDIRDVVMSEAGYGRTGAYNVVSEALTHLISSPFNGAELDEWAEETSNGKILSFEKFAGVDEGVVRRGCWFFDESGARDAYQQALVKTRIADAPQSRTKEAFDVLADERPSYVDEEWVEKERDLL